MCNCRVLFLYVLMYDFVIIGKTLAFGVPAIVHVLNKKKNKTCKRVNPQCLVLSPTRELAQQVSILILEYFKACTVCYSILNKVQFDRGC